MLLILTTPQGALSTFMSIIRYIIRYIVMYRQQEGWLGQEVVHCGHCGAGSPPRAPRDPVGTGTLPGTLAGSARCSSPGQRSQGLREPGLRARVCHGVSTVISASAVPRAFLLYCSALQVGKKRGFLLQIPASLSSLNNTLSQEMKSPNSEPTKKSPIAETSCAGEQPRHGTEPKPHNEPPRVPSVASHPP